MARRHLQVTDELHRYVLEHSLPADPLVRELTEETARRYPDAAEMQIAPDQGALLYLLVKISRARRVVELGTFTGMSSLWMARALPDDGRLLCLDVSEEWTAVARSYWERAGVADRVELRLGPALDTLRSLPPEPQFDLAFIDADKRSYPDYLTELVPRLVPGGVLLADNVLWSGKISDDPGESAEALRRFNRLVADHPDLEAVVLAFADGLTLARKRG